ncbi:MAG: hypothetical protein BAJATHORv1_150008 [Candidatus Thorarchaeota archaeon]|nr:MAG: hypothetical protein BAJATHORv1_150008 [Candidatus Thorarchaeota archaeon]
MAEDVGRFIGIGLQVEEDLVFLAIDPAVDIFVRSETEHASVGIDREELAEATVSLAVALGLEAPAVQPLWHRHTGQIEQRGHQVGRSDEGVSVHRAGGDRPRLTEDQHRPGRLLVEGDLGDQPMGAHYVAVIGGENDDRVLLQSDIAERVQHQLDVPIRLLDQQAVGGDVTLPIVLAPVGQLLVHVVLVADHARNNGGVVVGGQAGPGLEAEVEFVVGAAEEDRISERGPFDLAAQHLADVMRVDQRQHHVEGPVVVPAQVVDGVVGEDLVVGRALGQHPPGREPHAAELVDAVPGIVAGVLLAEVGRIIPRSLERGAERGHIGAGGVFPVSVEVDLLIVDDVVVVGHQAGEKTGPGRAAEGEGGVASLETDALNGQPVDARSLNPGVILTRPVGDSRRPLVGDDQNDVRLSTHHSLPFSVQFLPDGVP